MKIKNDPSEIDFNLSHSNNSWNIPVTADGRNKIGQNDLEYANEDGVTPIFNVVEINFTRNLIKVSVNKPT